MKKMFEDYFTEFQENMVSICLEYVEDKAEKTYIYRAYEENSIYGDHQDKRKPRDRRVVFFYTIMNTRQTGDHDLQWRKRCLPDKQSADCGRQQGDQQSGQYHVGHVACDDRVALAVNEPLKAAENDADRPEVGE